MLKRTGDSFVPDSFVRPLVECKPVSPELSSEPGIDGIVARETKVNESPRLVRKTRGHGMTENAGLHDGKE